MAKQEEFTFDDPMKKQVGDDKYILPYRSFVIQPVEFIQKNELNWCEGNVVKYVCRHHSKNGVEDLLKARHYIDMLIAMEYGDAQRNAIRPTQATA